MYLTREGVVIVYYVIYETGQEKNILGNFMTRRNAEEFVSSVRHWFTSPLRICNNLDLLMRN